MAFTSSEPDWENLPAPALSLVLDNLSDVIDHVWFSAVCKQWWFVANIHHDNQKKYRNQTLPMLLIPTKRKSRTNRSLYSIAANKIHNLKLPVPYSRRCCGSSHGWLATVDPYSVITLLNPFKKVAPIRLPPILEWSDWYLKFYDCGILKVTLSEDPTQNPNYVVAAIYNVSNQLAFIKAGQNFWTYVDKDIPCFTDIVFYKDRIFAVGRWSMIVSFDLCCSSDPTGYDQVTPDVLMEKCRACGYSERAYLVKSLEGDLWMVRRFLAYSGVDEDFRHVGTESFKVYRLEFDAETGKVTRNVKLDSLGDNVLFVGDNDSMSVSASRFSDCLQRDSIYFTDDFIDELFPVPYPSGPFDMGIYNVKNGRFSQHCPFNTSFRRMPPAVWILPPF